MNRRVRSRRESFETIMARFDGTERRTLADLHNLGYTFPTIYMARRYAKRIHANPAEPDEFEERDSQ